MIELAYTDNRQCASIFLLLSGLLLDAVVEEVPVLFFRLPHPVTIIGYLITLLDCRLNRQYFSRTSRKIYGFHTVLTIITLVVIVGIILQKLFRMVPYAWILEIFLIAILLAQRSLYQHVLAVANALTYSGLQGGRETVAKICGRDTQHLDESNIIRAAIESCAENFNDGVIAPVFWYLVCGIPGLLVYKTVNTLDSMIGHYNKYYQDFGFTAARLDDLLNWIPARLSGLLLVIAAAFVPTAQPCVAFQTMLQDAQKHRSPNSGWPEAAMAGALGIVLAGPRCYSGYKVIDDWIGINGRVHTVTYDINRSLNILLLACIINAGLSILLCIF